MEVLGVDTGTTAIESSAQATKGTKKGSRKRISAARKPYILSRSEQHLASRFSYGVDDRLLADIRKAGSAKKWFKKQLKPSKVSDPSGDKVAKWFPLLKDSPAKAWRKVSTSKRSSWDYGLSFVGYSIARRIETRRQVQEVMTDFWSNLLYIPMGEDRSFPHRRSYDRVVRANALGSYRALLRATVTHPAMSGWANNAENTKAGINENLGRELLELFTVGRGQYTESDVKNSARILTGYSVAVFDDFKAGYRPERHWVGTIRVLTFRHRNSRADGRAAVNAYLDYLARHPATARRIARRLCVKFVSDEPSKRIVKAVARAYRKSDTSIPATLKALVGHKDFGKAKRRKVRMPSEDIINTARVLRMRPTGGTSEKAFAKHLMYMSEQVGQAPYRWPRPDGFPEDSAVWLSSARVLRSWNMHYALAGSWWDSAQMSRPSRNAQLPSKSEFPISIGQLVEHQSRILLGRSSTKAMRKNAAKALGQKASLVFERRKDVSEWQWLLIQGTVLNSPEGVLR
ncbi:MAG: DUF1800 domain-containing protein [Aeromicrobium sp.]